MTLRYCVYILFSQKDNMLYIGFSTNVEARLEKHNSGGCKSTVGRRPLILIFCEYYMFEDDALKREMYFKINMGKKAIKLMLRNTLSKLGYNPRSLKSLNILNDMEQSDS
jgi:putative endonuclease